MEGTRVLIENKENDMEIEIFPVSPGYDGMVSLKWGTMYTCISLRQTEKPKLTHQTNYNLHWKPSNFLSEDIKVYFEKYIESLIMSLTNGKIPIILDYELVIYIQGYVEEKNLYLYLVLNGILTIFRHSGFYMNDIPKVILFSNPKDDQETKDPVIVKKWEQINFIDKNRLFLIIGSSLYIYKLIPLFGLPGIKLKDFSKFKKYFK